MTVHARGQYRQEELRRNKSQPLDFVKSHKAVTNVLNTAAVKRSTMRVYISKISFPQTVVSLLSEISSCLPYFLWS